MSSENTVATKAVSRRTLARGAAWAAPAVAATAAVPAYAASSSCVPEPQIGQAVKYDFGTYGWGLRTTNHWLDIQNSQFQIKGLPRNVYVTKVVEVLWIEQKTGNTTRGTWPMDDSRARITHNAECATDTCGWSDLTFYQKGVSKVTREGNRRQMWAAALSWTAVGNLSSGPVNFRYGPREGCFNHLTHKAGDDVPSGTQATRYHIDYIDVPAYHNQNPNQMEYYQWVWYYLSDGRVLATSNNPNDPAPALPPIEPRQK